MPSLSIVSASGSSTAAGQVLIDLAGQLLTLRIYSYLLGVLCDMNPIDFWAAPRRRFRAALTELSVPLPSREEAALYVTSYLVQEMIEGKFAPQDQCGHFVREYELAWDPLADYFRTNCGCLELVHFHDAYEEAEEQYGAGSGGDLEWVQ